MGKLCDSCSGVKALLQCARPAVVRSASRCFAAAMPQTHWYHVPRNRPTPSCHTMACGQPGTAVRVVKYGLFGDLRLAMGEMNGAAPRHARLPSAVQHDAPCSVPRAAPKLSTVFTNQAHAGFALRRRLRTAGAQRHRVHVASWQWHTFAAATAAQRCEIASGAMQRRRGGQGTVNAPAPMSGRAGWLSPALSLLAATC